MPDTAISRLLKVLALEKKQGYRNKAVIGGLDKFVSRWEAIARAEAPDPAAINEIVALLLGYPVMEDTAVRTRILEQVIRRANELSSARPAASEPPAPAQESPAIPQPAIEEVRPEKPQERPAEKIVPARSKPFTTAPAESRPAFVAPIAPAPVAPPPEPLTPAASAPPRLPRRCASRLRRPARSARSARATRRCGAARRRPHPFARLLPAWAWMRR